jgi:REP element-mobilizing transposase RayT
MAGEKIFPQRLHHATPAWVESDAVFHVRIRVAPGFTAPLTGPFLAEFLLKTVLHYHTSRRWGCRLFLIMPDHVHMLAAFPDHEEMGKVIGDWKRYIAKHAGVLWQTNFFDHRIRQEAEFREKWDYILRNPVVKDLCPAQEAWPWVLIPE